jgi:predicted DsbA family dithiol-disulfide isomerase
VRPPEPLLDPRAEPFASRWERARDAAREDGLELARPRLVPWSRKAHELVLHARERGAGRELHEAVFRAFHEERRDIGRVDVLVDLAVEAGLDLTETKAVLDVDRHAETLRRLRRIAERAGVPGVPTLLVERRTLQGIPDTGALRSALTPASPDNPTSR